MASVKFVYYEEGEWIVGWLEDYPDYRTQGATLDELKESLRDIYHDLTSGQVPQARKYGELVVG